MKIPQPSVCIVDDDSAMRDSMHFMLTSAGYSVTCFCSGEEFLENGNPHAHGCLILDLRMPGFSGAQVHQHLNNLHSSMPVIILTAHGDIPTAVDHMKLGAFEFLSKPVNRDVLLSAVSSAIEKDRTRWQQSEEISRINTRLVRLTPRELEIMDRIAQGQASKLIASQLGLSYKTVSNHRDHILKKMEADNTASLVRMLGRIGRFSSYEHKYTT